MSCANAPFYNDSSVLQHMASDSRLILGLCPANEMGLLFNNVSHWLGTSLESTRRFQTYEEHPIYHHTVGCWMSDFRENDNNIFHISIVWHNVKGQYCMNHIVGLVQERHNSIANAMELRLSCTNPSICSPDIKVAAYFCRLIQPFPCEIGQHFTRKLNMLQALPY